MFIYQLDLVVSTVILVVIAIIPALVVTIVVRGNNSSDGSGDGDGYFAVVTEIGLLSDRNTVLIAVLINLVKTSFSTRKLLHRTQFPLSLSLTKCTARTQNL